MARAPQSKGTCTYCGAEMAVGGMGRHLASCVARRAAIEAADAAGREHERVFHLRVQDEHARAFWLHLEMRGSATLKQLDAYLRAIWLECCGHLSQFMAGGWDQKVAMTRRAADVFKPGLTLEHEYDFGTTSYTIIQVLDVRVGAPTTAKPIALLARNLPPADTCTECGEPATHLCLECMMEMEGPGTLCAAHAESHPHDDYGEPVPLVNSPRMGMCGYTGPADPPD